MIDPASPAFVEAIYNIMKFKCFEGENISVGRLETRKQFLYSRMGDVYPTDQGFVDMFVKAWVDETYQERELCRRLETLDQRRRRLLEFIDDADKSIHLLGRSTFHDFSEKKEILDKVVQQHDFKDLLGDLYLNHLERVEILQTEHIMKLDLSEFLAGRSADELLPSTSRAGDKKKHKAILKGEKVALRFKAGDFVLVRRNPDLPEDQQIKEVMGEDYLHRRFENDRYTWKLVASPSGLGWKLEEY